MPTDKHHVEIKIDSIVAYNQSGTVRLGQVTKIIRVQPPKWGFQKESSQWHFKIRPMTWDKTGAAVPLSTKTESTVRSAWNLMVIPAVTYFLSSEK